MFHSSLDSFNHDSLGLFLAITSCVCAEPTMFLHPFSPDSPTILFSSVTTVLSGDLTQQAAKPFRKPPLPHLSTPYLS